mmetsp:Transcript_7976/g.23370  ORF Transcript_7976/g.23370 Transcript_7976/m.23370 type:complete len:259 (-) Transcript_7976:2-778(-)
MPHKTAGNPGDGAAISSPPLAGKEGVQGSVQALLHICPVLSRLWLPRGRVELTVGHADRYAHGKPIHAEGRDTRDAGKHGREPDNHIPDDNRCARSDVHVFRRRVQGKPGRGHGSRRPGRHGHRRVEHAAAEANERTDTIQVYRDKLSLLGLLGQVGDTLIDSLLQTFVDTEHSTVRGARFLLLRVFARRIPDIRLRVISSCTKADARHVIVDVQGSQHSPPLAWQRRHRRHEGGCSRKRHGGHEGRDHEGGWNHHDL